MIFLLKSHVRGFSRHYISGALGSVKDFDRKTPVMFKPVGGKSIRSGTVVDIGPGHYTIQGKRDAAGKVETHIVPAENVVSIGEREKKEPKVPGKGVAVTAEESKRRAEIGKNRIGMTESDILKHPKVKATVAGSTYKLARSNGLDTAMIKDGDVIQVQDADYQDMIHEHIMGATNALRRETANAPDGDIEEFKNYLNGKAETSRIAAQMATEGKGAAIRFLNKRKEEKESLVDTTSLDDPEGRGTGKMSQLFSAQSDQDEHVAGPLHVGVDRVLSNLPDVHAEIIKRKFGLNEFQPQSNKDIAEALNDKGLKYQDKYKWDRNYVGQAFNDAVMDLRDVAGVEELKDFLKSVRERLTLLKSRKMATVHLPYLIKSYSSDLAKEHPGGHWVTVRQGPLEGRHLFIVSGDGGARVVAGGGPAMKGRVLGGKGSVGGKEKPESQPSSQGHKGTVNLTIQGLKGLEKKTVEADIHGHLAVHKTEGGEGYQITHAPTDLHIKDSIPTKESATELAHKLNNAGVEWNFSDPDSTMSEMYGKVKDVLREHEESQKKVEESKPELGKIEKIAMRDGRFKLTGSQHNTLMAVRHEINEGTPGRRIPIKDDEGYITGWTAEPSTYPDYFQGKGYTRADALNAIDKALNNKKLTKKQQILVEDLNHSYRQMYATRIAKERATKEATAFHLKEGDTLKRHGTKYVVKKVDNSGFFPIATLQDGAVLKIEGDETIGYDRGTLKDANGLQKSMMGFPYLLKKHVRAVEAAC